MQLLATGAGDVVVTTKYQLQTAANYTFQTNGGDIVMWSNNTAASRGRLFIGANNTFNSIGGQTNQATGGGDIIFAGGVDNGNNRPLNYARDDTREQGIYISSGLEVYSGGGAVTFKGRTNLSNRSGTRGISFQGDLTIYSGEGSIAFDGQILQTRGAAGYGIEFASSTSQSVSVISDLPNGDAITINGNNTTNTYGVYFHATASGLFEATNNGNIVVKTARGIITRAGYTFQTNGGNLVFWSDTDGSGTGRIYTLDPIVLNSAGGATDQDTGGGAIVLAGGLDDGSNGGIANDGIPDGFAYDRTWRGVLLGNGAQMFSGGGDVVIRGRTFSTALTYGIQQNNDLHINSGQGKITLHGKTRTSHAGGGVLLANGGTTNGLSLISDKPSGTAIEIIGESRSYGVISNSGASSKTIAATGGGDVVIDGKTPSAGYGVYLRDFDILAADGAITINGHTTGFWLYDLTFGQLTNTLVASSDADVILRADRFRTSGSSSIDTAGNVVLEPQSASFDSELVFPLSNVSLDSKASALRLGKADNTNDVSIDNAVLINGPIDIHGRNININGALTAVAANIQLFATGDVKQTAGLEAAGIGLNGSARYILDSKDNSAGRLAAGSSQVPVASLTYLNGVGGVRIGEVNPSGIHSTGPVLIETLNGNIVVEQPISSDSTLNSISGYTGAVVLNAGRDQDIGIPEGGNVQVIANGDITAPGIIKLYSGVRSKSTGVPSLAGGDDNIRVGVNKTITDFEPELTANETHGLFRAVARGEGNLTIVASGGGDEDVEWDYRAELGSLSTLIPEATITAADLLARLASGDLVISANTITVEAAIEATTTTHDLTLYAATDIIVAADIKTNGGNLVLRSSTSEGADKGAIVVHGSSSSTTTIDTQGGHIWLGGGFNDAIWNGLTVGDGLALLGAPKRPVPASSDVIYAGIAIDSARLDTGGGDVSFNAGALTGVDPISGENHRETGLALLGSADITSGTGTVTVNATVATDDGHGIALLAADNESIMVHSVSTNTTTPGIHVQTTTASANQVPIEVNGDVIFDSAEGAPLTVSVDNDSAPNGASVGASGAWSLLAPSGHVSLDVGQSTLKVASDATLTFASSVTATTPASADVSLVFSQLDGPVAVDTTGDVSVTSPAGTSFGGTLDTSNLSISGPAGNIQLGQVGNTSDIALNQAVEATSMGLIGDTVTLNDPLTADQLAVTAATALTQSADGNLHVGDLRLRGSAAVALTAAANTIDQMQLRGSTSQLASIDLTTTGDLILGGTNSEVLRSVGTVDIATTTGDIDLRTSLVSQSADTPAVVINAGRDQAVGDVMGGDLKVAPGADIAVASGGQVRLFSGTAANSTGVLALADTVQSFVDENTSLSNLGDINALFRSAVPEQIAIIEAPTTTNSGATLSPAFKVALADQFGNTLPLKDKDISVALFSASGVQLSGTLTQSTDDNGEASFTDLALTGLVGSSVRLRFSANGVEPAIPATISEPITVSGPGAASAADSTFTATPSGNVEADNTDASLLVISVTDAAGNPISDQSVGFQITSGTGGAVSDPSGSTNLIGQFAAELTSDTAGDIAVEACLSTDCSSGSIGSLIVGFIAGPPAKIELIEGDDQTAQVDTPLSTPLKVKVTDSEENQVTGATVQFAGDGTTSLESVVTNSSGEAEVTWTLGKTAGAQTMTATLPGATTADDSVTFNATAEPGPFAQLGLSVGDPRLLTTIPFDLTVTLEDRFGNATTHGSDVYITLTADNLSHSGGVTGAIAGTLTHSTLTIAKDDEQAVLSTDYDGLSAPSVEAGDIELTADDADSSKTGDLLVTVRKIELEISADPFSIEAGSEELATITATLQDIKEVGVAGQPMAFETTLGFFVDDNGQALGPVAQLTGDSTAGSEGQATIKLKAGSSEGQAEITVRSRGADPVTTTVDFTGGVAVASQSTLRVEPSVLSTDDGGVDTATVTLQLRDQFGNTTDQLPDNTQPALTLAKNYVTLSGTLTDLEGGRYTQTIDATTTAGVEEITATIGGEDTEPATVTLVPGAPSQLTRVSGDGQAGPVGQALPNPVVVRLVDENNNAIAYKDISFGVDSGSVSNTPVSTDLQGFAATTWTLGTASGAQSLTASYEVDTGTTIDAQFSATAQPGAATQLKIQTQPDGTTSGQHLTSQPVIQVLDDDDNLVTDATGQVIATLNTGASRGRLSGSTSIAISAGRATFTDLVLAGKIDQDFTLDFSSTGLVGDTSDAFQLDTAGAAANIVILSSTDTADIGAQWQNLPFDFKARVTDEFGNTASLSGDNAIVFSGETLDAEFTAGVNGELLKARTREKITENLTTESTQPGDTQGDKTAPQSRTLKTPIEPMSTGGEVAVDSAVYSGASAPNADDVVVTAVIVDSDGESTGIEGTSSGFTVAPTELSLSANDIQLLATADSETQITVSLTSEGSAVTTPTEIELTVTQGNLVDSNDQIVDLNNMQTTDENGSITLTYQPGTSAGTATITALCPGVCEAQTTIEVVPDYTSFFSDVRSQTLVPTMADYQALTTPLASADSLALVTDAIISLPDQINDGAELTALVDLVDRITQASNGDAATEPGLTQADYQLLSLSRIDSQDKRDLMNHILGTLPANSVTKYSQLVTMASATSKLVNFTSGNTNSLGLSVSEFGEIGIVGVTSDNLAAVLAGLEGRLPQSGALSSLDTVQGHVSDLISEAFDALLDGGNGNGQGGATSPEQYGLAGISGVTADNVDLVNEMLASFSKSVPSPTAAQIQSLVDSTVAISEALSLSDGERTGGLQLDANGYQALGLSHIDLASEAALLNEFINTGSGDLGANLTSIEAASLTIDRLVEFIANGALTPSLTLTELASLGITDLTEADLDTYLEAVLEEFAGDQPITLQALHTVADRVVNEIDQRTEKARASLLADAMEVAEQDGADAEQIAAIETAVDHIIRVVAGQDTQLTVEDFVALGLAVEADELPGIIEALEATPRNGSGVNSMAKIQQLVEALRLSDSDAGVIAAVSGLLDPDAETSPGVSDYAAAGVFGVDDDNVGVVDAFVQAARGGDNGVTRSQLQATINAVNALQAEANGDATTPASLTADDYAAMGMPGIQSDDELALINSVVGGLTADQAADPAAIEHLVTMAINARAGQPVTAEQLVALNQTTPSSDMLSLLNQALASGARPADSAALQRIIQTAEDIASGNGRSASAETLADGTLPDLLPGEIRHRLNGQVLGFNRTGNARSKTISTADFRLGLSGECGSQDCRVRVNGGRETLEITTDGSARLPGLGFFPGSKIDLWIFSTPVFLGDIDVSDDGSFDATKPLGDIEAGSHTLQANGLSLDGELRSVEIGIVVIEAPTTDNESDPSDPSSPSNPVSTDPLGIPVGRGWGWLLLVAALLWLGQRTLSHRQARF
jgi:hypothetical protein